MKFYIFKSDTSHIVKWRNIQNARELFNKLTRATNRKLIYAIWAWQSGDCFRRKCACRDRCAQVNWADLESIESLAEECWRIATLPEETFVFEEQDT